MRSILLVCFIALGCMPKEDVVFRKVLNPSVDLRSSTPMLKADMVFFNPNKTRMKLKQMHFDIFVDDKKAGLIDQKLNQVIEGNSEFTVPIEVQLSLKEFGLLNAVIGFLGGKKYVVHMVGKVRGSVHGITIGVPVDHKEEIRIR